MDLLRSFREWRAVASGVFLLNIALGLVAGTALAADKATTQLPRKQGINGAGAAHPWRGGSSDEGLSASTRTEKGALGQYCDVRKAACMWVIVLSGDACSEGGERPVLINTDREASLQTVRCLGAGMQRGAAFAFTEFDSIDSIVRRAERIAVAVPALGDKIGVYYFALSGAVVAIDRMRAELIDQLQGADAEGPELPTGVSAGPLQQIVFRSSR